MPKLPFWKIALLWVIGKLGELLIWGLFVVGFGLLPIYLVYEHNQARQLLVPLADLVVRGELLLVATAIAADSLSRLVSNIFANSIKRKRVSFGIRHLIIFLTSVAFLVLSASQYADLLSGGVVPEFVFAKSRIYFICTMLIGAGAILVD
jgi:hypothetical protein